MYTNIVTGTNGTPRAQQAAAVAADLARVHGADLHLVWAYRRVTESAGAFAGPDVMAAAIVSDRDVEQAVEAELQAAAGELARDGLKVHTHAICGTAADALIQVAEAEGAEVIVVGNKGMHGARRMLGSIPNTVAHHAGCSVLIVPTDR